MAIYHLYNSERSDTGSGGTTRKPACGFCQQGLFHQISVEMRDFIYSHRKLLFFSRTHRNSTPCKKHLGSPPHTLRAAAPAATLLFPRLLLNQHRASMQPEALSEFSKGREHHSSSIHRIQQATRITHESWLPPE